MAKAHTLSPGGEQRVLLGFFVQPFLTALLGFALFPVMEYTGRLLGLGRAVDTFDAARSLGLGMGIVGTLVTTFGAFPALMLLLRRGPVSRRQTLISGMLLGNLPGVLTVAGLAIRSLRQGVMPTLDALTYGFGGAVRALAVGSFVGLVAAGVFWLVAGRDIGAGRATPVG